MIDEKGIWKVSNIGSGISTKTLITPSESYLLEIRLEEAKDLKSPIVSKGDVQLANFILDVSQRLEKLEGGKENV